MKILAWPAWKTKEYNPYNAQLYTNLQRIGGVDVTEYGKRQILWPKQYALLHIHWPDVVFRDVSRGQQLYQIILFFREIAIAKLWGIRIVWTVHNLRPHCRRNEVFEEIFYKIWLCFVDGMIFLTHHSKIAFRDKYSKTSTKPQVVIPHGHYRDMILEHRTPEVAKKLLGLESGMRYLVFIGRIRPYKNIPRLIECFKLANMENWRLVIAGLADDMALVQQLSILAENDSRITLNFGLLSDKQLEVFTQAADLVVLPYKSVLNSGSIVYALSCGRSVLVPKSETFCELRDLTEAEGIIMYEGELKPQDLRDAINVLRPDAKVNLNALEWENIARMHKEFFGAVIEN